ncbi:hypothetical protein ACO0M4_05560 [Streptomyces sp. RGM 3693]|uniref:hypothetical protein n=1 Tax=Streptomyces sp. RGM 3693 TaxID=3413284 RepID=UPI003D2E4664
MAKPLRPASAGLVRPVALVGIRHGSGENGHVYGRLLTLNALAGTPFEVPRSRGTGRWQRRIAPGMVPRASAEATP